MDTSQHTLSTPKSLRSAVFISKNTHLGGAELAMLSLMKQLQASGIQLHLFTGESGTLHSHFEKLCTTVVTCPLPYSRKPTSWLRIPKFCRHLLRLKSSLPQIVDCVANDVYETFAALLASQTLGASRTLGFWQSSYNFRTNRESRKWTKYGGDKLDLRLAADPVASHLNLIRRSDHTVLPFNPLVDESRFCASKYNRLEIRSRLKWDHTHHGIVVGRIGDAKGQIALANTFLKVRANTTSSAMQKLRLCIVGPAAPRDRLTLSFLEQQSGGCVQYLGERSDIPELLTASDLALFPGIIPESFGLAIHEAILIGTPVLALENEGAVKFHLANCPASRCASLEEMIEKWEHMASKASAPFILESDRQAAVDRCGLASFVRQVNIVFPEKEH